MPPMQQQRKPVPTPRAHSVSPRVQKAMRAVWEKATTGDGLFGPVRRAMGPTCAFSLSSPARHGHQVDAGWMQAG